MPSATRTVSPFPQVPRAKRKPQRVEPDLLKVERGVPPPRVGTRPGRSKFDALFDGMKVGDCVVCEPGEREHIRGAMLKWAKKRGKQIAVRSQTTCTDGAARVWMLAAE